MEFDLIVRKPGLTVPTWMIGTGALVMSAIGASNALVAQTAQQQPRPGQIIKQFGPRVNKPAQAGAGQQRTGPKKPANSEIVGKHGDWLLTCEKQPAKQADGTSIKPCGMLQSAQHAERKNIALTLVLLKGEKDGKPNTMMRVMAPIGVFLPTGVALEIDGEAVGRVPFTRCLPQVCIAFAEASPPTLEKMKKGGKANFIIYEAPGLGMSLELSLKGFTAGLKQLHGL